MASSRCSTLKPPTLKLLPVLSAAESPTHLRRPRITVQGVDNANPEDEGLKDIDDLALVERALALAPNLDTDDGDEDGYWKVIRELHRRGSGLIFHEASQLILSKDDRARRLACDILAQLGYDESNPFAAETIPLLAYVCDEETVPSVLDSAISAMGHLGRSEALPFVVAHAKHADVDVRFAVAYALPSIAGIEWVDTAHPAVTTLMQLTTDEDVDVRDWATFGLGSQVKVDGAAVRQCLFDRLDDPDEETRAEAMVGLAKRHAPGIAGHVLDALCANTVSRYAVESACALADPVFGERLGQMMAWWVVDVHLFEDARRRCDPSRIDREVAVATSLAEAAGRRHLSISVSCELLPFSAGDPEIALVGGGIHVAYGMEELMRRADGSVEAAVSLIEHDLADAPG
jgi:HEAT repeats